MTFDAEILQDFLTESGELIERLEADLVTLECDPADPEMLNQVFRALHSFKGSASFLALSELVEIAHAAESSLNAARNRVVSLDRVAMDLLLQAVDLMKTHLGQVREGSPLSAAPDRLVRTLAALGEGKSPTPKPASPHARTAASTRPKSSPLSLQENKLDLLDFLIADLEETLAKIDAAARSLHDEDRRGGSARVLAEHAEALVKATAFFECRPMIRMAELLAEVAAKIDQVETACFDQIMPRVAALLHMLAEQTAGLKRRELVEWPSDLFERRLRRLLSGTLLDAEALPLPPTVEGVMAHDGLTGIAAHLTPAEQAETPATTTGDSPISTKAAGQQTATHEQTIRVEVGRLDTLMRLVGELVLHKNRVAALSRGIGTATTPAQAHDLADAMTLAASGLDRVTADIQLAVMRTRMRPLEKLFGRYPRLIRDLASKTAKQIDLVVEGGSAEVDKLVIDALADPLMHLMRNAADHGLESPQDRAAAGKSPTGTIRLAASHQADHVRIVVSDDGRGLSRERILAKAVERGIVRPDQAQSMTDPQVFNLIFLPGFSTTDQVSDLSGRGVGMDVVRTNIEKIKGSIELSSEPGRGATVTITIPVTVAILPAMMVAVAGEIYAIPLNNILDIIRPSAGEVSTISGRPVMRLHDSVLPLVSVCDVFGLPEGHRDATPFTVVLVSNERRVGLMVSRLIGRHEVVIKAPDTTGSAPKSRARVPVSGATVRDDGGVSLIIDVAELIRLTHHDPAGS